MRAIKICIILIALTQLSSVTMASDAKVPPIRNVGVIPVQWRGSDSPLSPLAKFKEVGSNSFSSIVRGAKRFQIINDAIVANNWDSADGRRLLDEQFELHGLMSLDFEETDDLLIASVRLLSPKLKTYLLESDRITRTWLKESSMDQQQERLRRLVFRLLNRYPIDVFVTSTQGSFITLSGGKNQSLFEGDELDFYQVEIKATHPVNGSWINYQKKYLGKAIVIDSKQYSAIAKLSSLAYEGAITIGSSAKIKHISSRKVFSSIEKNFQDEQDFKPKDRLARLGGTPQAAPTTNDIPIPKAAAKAPEQALPPGPAISQKQAEVVEEETFENEEPQDSATPPTEEAESLADGPGFMENTLALVNELLRSMHVLAAYDMWSASGTASTSSTRPLWVANHFEAWGETPLDDKTMLRLMPYLSYSPTSDGSALALGLRGDYSFKLAKPGFLFQQVDSIEFGAYGDIGTSKLNGSTYGGMNSLALGPMAKLNGRYHLVDSGKTIEFQMGIRSKMLAFGSAGIGGQSRSLSGIFGYQLEANGIVKGQPGVFEWGGLVRYSMDSYSMDGASLKIGGLSLGLLARMRL